METGEQIDTTDAVEETPRDYETEARALGWTPKEDFKGDEKRWFDAETFVRRGEEVMPLLKAQNKKLREDINELKREQRRAAEFFSKAEERAYTKALQEIERKHTEAVEVGDTSAARAAVNEMRTLEKDFESNKLTVEPEKTEAPSQDQLRAELETWVASNDWYGVDDNKTRYADLQAQLMGPAENYAQGRKSWFDELAKRVESKFSERPVSVNARPGARVPAKGGKTYADLPPDAKKLCDKWVANGVIKTRDDYVKSYQWD